MSPFFSIIVPVYNVEDYLKRCIESLINQSYQNIEILLVNDGSTDNSPAICMEYTKLDNRIIVIHKENGGLSDARNTGLIAAKGEYIIFVDSDDFIDLDTCELFYEQIKNDNFDIITGNIKGEKAELFSRIEGNNDISGADFLKNQLLHKTWYVSVCRNVYRNDFIKKNNLFFKEGVFHEDELWTPKVFLNAKSVNNSNIIFYNRTIRAGSISRQKSLTRNALDIIEISNELQDYYKNILDEELKKILFDNLVGQYLNAFYIGKLVDKKYKILFDKEFLKQNALSKRNKLKVRLFILNKYLYYYINKINKSLINALKIS